MKKILFFILIMMIPFVVNGLEIKDELISSFDKNNSDYLESIEIDKKNNYIVIGETTSSDIEGFPSKGGLDCLIMKYDNNWNLLWTNSYGGKKSDYLYDLTIDDDNNYYVVGETYSTDITNLTNGYALNGAAVILKYDENGNLLWERFWGGSGSDSFNSIIMDKDGGVIVVGETSSLEIEGSLQTSSHFIGVIIKYDKDGNVVWLKKYLGDKSINFNYITNSNDGGFLVTGSSAATNFEDLENIGSADALFLKFDSSFNIENKILYGGTLGDGFTKVIESDDFYYFLGDTSSVEIKDSVDDSSNDSLIVKYDKNGNFLWKNSFGGSGYDVCEDFELLNNNIIAVCSINSSDIEGMNFKGGSYDTVLLRYSNFDGKLLGFNSNGGNGEDYFKEIFCTSNTECLIGGYSSSTDLKDLPLTKSAILVFNINYSYTYSISENIKFGNVEVSYDNNYGVISTVPNEGYMVNKVIVKDSSDNIVNTMKKEKNKYVYDLYDDVSIDVNFVKIFNVNKTDIVHGALDVVKNDDNFVMLSPIPDNGYEFDKIIIKNSKDEIVEVTSLDDGVYSFELNDDVTVEVLFKQIIENPKTGIRNIAGILFTICLCFISVFLVLKNYNKSCEL
ncbi:MAG: hypothetical protein IJ399_02435 [Bacilli bacterium]|nr:hypothetical protein [Bacilli bacterium]